MAKAAAPKVPKLNDLLSQLDEAFEYAQTKNELLAQAHAEQTQAVKAAQDVFDAVRVDHDKRVQDAATSAEQARLVLEQVRLSVNERVGSLTGQATDSRVSVR